MQFAVNTMFTAENGDRDSADNFIILVTDGASDERSATIANAIAARRANIRILVVSIGKAIYGGEFTVMNFRYILLIFSCLSY